MSQSQENGDSGQSPIGPPGGLDRAREQMIHEYIRQARARLQAASAPARPEATPLDTSDSDFAANVAAESQISSQTRTESAETTASVGTSHAINSAPTVPVIWTSDVPSQPRTSAPADAFAASEEEDAEPMPTSNINSSNSSSSASAAVSPFPFPATYQTRGGGSRSQRNSLSSRSQGTDWPLTQPASDVPQDEPRPQHPSQRAGAGSTTTPAPGSSTSIDAYSNSFPSPPSASPPKTSQVQGLGLTLAENADRPSANFRLNPQNMAPQRPSPADSPPDLQSDSNQQMKMSQQYINQIPSSTAQPVHNPVAFRAFAHSLQLPSVPVIPEESEGQRSIRSSVLSNSTDVLFEGSENGRVYSGYSDFLSGYDGRDSGADQDVAPAQVVRQASVSQRQRPIIRDVSIGSRKGDEGEYTPRSGSLATSEPEASNTRVTAVDVIGEVPLETAALGESTNENQTPSLRPIQQPLSPDFPRSPSPGASRNSTPQKSVADRARSRSPLIPASSRFSPRVSRNGTVSPFGSPQVTHGNRSEALRELEHSDRPQVFDPNVVKAVDTRASTTSLKTLILRNMKLASNLERGETSSKFGLDWILSAGNNNTIAKAEDLPASGFNFFPDEKPREFPRREQAANWTATARGEPDAFQLMQQEQRRRRQLCGLPLWGFVLTLIAIVILAAAAILVPVGLIVIPGQNNTSTPRAPGTCQHSLDCGPHGSIASSFAHGVCRCVCTDGFTGDTCSARKTGDCSTANIAQFKKATVGSDVLQVFKASQRMPNVALDEVQILSLFSTTGASCGKQNSLVSFSSNTLADRDASEPSEPLVASASSRTRVLMTMSVNASHVEDGASYPARLDTRGQCNDGEPAVTNAIIVARSSAPVVTGTPASPPTTPTSMTVTTSTAPSSIPSPGGVGFDPSSRQTLLFARVAVLYVFQETSRLSQATEAHAMLKKFLANPSTSDPTYVNLGNGWKANFVRRRVWYSGAQ